MNVIMRAMKHYYAFFATAFAFAIAVTSCVSNPAPVTDKPTLATITSPEASVIISGTKCSAREAELVIVRNQVALASVWSRLMSREIAPTFDFKNRIIVALFMGTRNTGGYGYALDSIRQASDGTIILSIIERSPGIGQSQTEALTSPFLLVSIPASVKDPIIEFAKTKLK